MTPFEFCRDPRHQEIRVHGLSYGVVLRDPTFSRFSTTPTCDKETDIDRQTHDYTAHTAPAWLASRGRMNTTQHKAMV